MKFLGTLAVGFSSVAAMLAALLSFGFHVKVESPINQQQAAQEQQLGQCTVALDQARQEVTAAQGKVQSLETRLGEAALIAEQTATRLSAEVAQRTRLANENAAFAGGSTSIATGIGAGLLMFPLGFLLGRRQRGERQPLLNARRQDALAVEPPREPVNALPLFDARRAQPRTGAVR